MQIMYQDLWITLLLWQIPSDFWKAEGDVQRWKKANKRLGNTQDLLYILKYKGLYREFEMVKEDVPFVVGQK